MQRTVVLIRHAKSSWANPMQSDFERPLNVRGATDAPRMGVRLKHLEIIPDVIISSTAKRAAHTAMHIAEKVGYSNDAIKWVDKLYHCIPAVFEEVLYELDDDIKTVFIVAHNPGISDFAGHLSPHFHLDHMPTCGVVAAHLEADRWTEFSVKPKQVFLFEYPKKLL